MSSDRTKLKRLSSLMSNPSWTPARHRDMQSLQSPPSLVSLDVKDARAAKADQKPSASTSPEQLVAPAHWHCPPSSNVDPSASGSHAPPSEYFTADNNGDTRRLPIYTGSSVVADLTNDSIILPPGSSAWYPVPSALLNEQVVQAMPTNWITLSKPAEQDAMLVPASVNAVAQSYICESARLRDDSNASLSRDSALKQLMQNQIQLTSLLLETAYTLHTQQFILMKQTLIGYHSILTSWWLAYTCKYGKPWVQATYSSKGDVGTVLVVCDDLAWTLLP